jgi:hypothetical protein
LECYVVIFLFISLIWKNIPFISMVYINKCIDVNTALKKSSFKSMSCLCRIQANPRLYLVILSNLCLPNFVPFHLNKDQNLLVCMDITVTSMLERKLSLLPNKGHMLEISWSMDKLSKKTIQEDVYVYVMHYVCNYETATLKAESLNVVGALSS